MQCDSLLTNCQIASSQYSRVWYTLSWSASSSDFMELVLHWLSQSQLPHPESGSGPLNLSRLALSLPRGQSTTFNLRYSSSGVPWAFHPRVWWRASNQCDTCPQGDGPTTTNNNQQQPAPTYNNQDQQTKLPTPTATTTTNDQQEITNANTARNKYQHQYYEPTIKHLKGCWRDSVILEQIFKKYVLLKILWNMKC